MRHLKKYVKGNVYPLSDFTVLTCRIEPKDKGHLRDTTSQNPKGQD